MAILTKTSNTYSIGKHVVEPAEVYEKFYKFGRSKKGTYFELPNGPETRFGTGADDILDLNWLSVEDIAYNEQVVPGNQLGYVSAILTPELYHQNTTSKSVLNSLLGSMAGAKNFDKVCLCCTRGGQNYACDFWRYCEKCACRKRQRFHKMYYYAYENIVENIYHITITPKDFVDYNTTELHVVTDIWDKYQDYVRMMIDKGIISGAFVVEEMSVEALVPAIKVNPHIHILCTSKHELTSHGLGEDIKVCVKQIHDRSYYKAVLDYLPKAIDLAPIYANSWTKENGRKVNQNFREIVCAYREMSVGRKQCKAYGVFHGKANNTIVISSEDYKRYAALDPDKKKKAGKKKIVCNQSFKKIQYTDEPMQCNEKQANVPPMPQANQAPSIPSTQPVQKKKSWLWPTALMGAGTLGALYAYGRKGGNFMSPISDTIHESVVHPVKMRAEPYYQKYLPQSWQDNINAGYKDQVHNYLQAGQAEGFVNQVQKALPSQLDGTAFEQTQNPLNRTGRAVGSMMMAAMVGKPVVMAGYDAAKSVLSGADRAAALASARATAEANKGMVSKILAGTIPKHLGAGVAGLAALPDGMELGGAAADKFNLTGASRNAAEYIGGASGMAAAFGGARIGGSLGARIPGPPPVKAVGAVGGSVLGGMTLPLINMFRRQENQKLLEQAGFEGGARGLGEAFREALYNKYQYGNDNMLNAWFKSVPKDQWYRIAAQVKDENLRALMYHHYRN